MLPCREGTGWLEKYYTESKTVTDVKKTLICYGYQSKIEGNTICPLGDAASWPVAAAIRHFRENLNIMFVSQKNKKQDLLPSLSKK
jgi:NADH-quinone oxidoreductase subunit F